MPTRTFLAHQLCVGYNVVKRLMAASSHCPQVKRYYVSGKPQVNSTRLTCVVDSLFFRLNDFNGSYGVAPPAALISDFEAVLKRVGHDLRAGIQDVLKG